MKIVSTVHAVARAATRLWVRAFVGIAECETADHSFGDDACDSVLCRHL